MNRDLNPSLSGATVLPELPALPKTVGAARTPAWNLEALVLRSCPVCRASQYKELVRRPDKLVVGRCTACGMTYIPWVPSSTDLNRLYQEYGRFKGYRPANLGRFRKYWRCLSNPYLTILEDTGGVRNQTLCEIGCSYGEFLQLARFRGATAFGVEVDAEASASIQKRGIACVADLDLYRRSFDMVCMLQLLEHLADPGVIVRKVSDSVVPDGRVLISVPNGGEIRELGHTWLGFRVDLEHLNYFDIGTLTALLTSNGLYVEHYWHHLQPSVARDPAEQRRVPSGGRLLPGIQSTLKKLIGTSVMEYGSFVLTVLARKPSA